MAKNTMSVDLPAQVAVVGLGYVGLPLAAAFGRVIPTIGFDVNGERIEELKQGRDSNGELGAEALRTPNLRFTADPAALGEADFTVVAVPTPVDRAKRPDLSYLVAASHLVGGALKSRRATDHAAPPIVVYESTVYPGCTEDVCVPVLEEVSGLKAGTGFKVGYSPERVNPGDEEHTIETVVKVVAAQDPEALEVLARVYGLVVRAGVYRAPDIRTAEASKVIENIQRDLNIALMNELAMLYHRMGIDTQEVLKAARSKWNFMPFEPGLVGGHCIPVDPYYLTYKAEELGYHPEMILAGRRINDTMGLYVAREAVRLMVRAGKAVQGSDVLVLGTAFKENVRDMRNSRVLDMIREVESYGAKIKVHDPLVDAATLAQLGLEVVESPFTSKERYDAVVLAVPHDPFRERGLDDYLSLFKKPESRQGEGAGPGVFVDPRGVFARGAKKQDGILYWSL